MCLGRGLIPARAGKTSTRLWMRTPSGAHPRAGGENHGVESTVANQVGSSPRGRGKLTVPDRAVRMSGLIPARAGKTAYSCPHGSRSAAHPRAGGENHRRRLGIRLTRGSSPRGRGKPARLIRRQARIRLIPARAGKTGMRPHNYGSSRAHPRAGGENAALRAARVAAAGSSPRGRGKHCLSPSLRFGGRLIPARAGKTGALRCRA